MQMLERLAKAIDEELLSTVEASLSAARAQAQTVRAARITFAGEASRSSRLDAWEGSGPLGDC